MELTQAGMKVLMLEAGAGITPSKDFGHKYLYQLDYRGQGKPGYLLTHYQGSEKNYPIMIDIQENPYTTAAGKPFEWNRSRILGRTHPALGPSHRPHGRVRIQSGFARRLRRGLADRVRRPQAVLRSRGTFHRGQCGACRTAAISPTASFCLRCRLTARNPYLKPRRATSAGARHIEDSRN